MDIVLLVLAVLVVGAPLIGIAIVTIGIFREESLHSLIGRAPGSVARGGRRLLNFHSESVFEPVSQADAWRDPVSDDDPMFDDQPEVLAEASPWRTAR